MKFFELEDKKEYLGGKFKYTKINECLYFYSEFSGQWVPTTLNLYEAYKLDFTEIKSNSHMRFEELSNGITIENQKTRNSLSIELNHRTFDKFASDVDGDVLFITVNDESIALTLDEFDNILDYIDKVKKLIEEVKNNEN